MHDKQLQGKVQFMQKSVDNSSRPPRPGPTPSTMPQNLQNRSRILVVDDSPEMTQWMTLMLEHAGYEVVAVHDGESALALVRDQPFNLILLDAVMPGLDGFEVCARLKADEATRAIPVIFISALDDSAAETRGLALGAADFVTKPINVAVLLARVKTHLALYAQRRSLEGMFRDVIEFAPDAFILADPQGRIVQINARAEALFGYRRSELLGQPVETLIPAHLRQAHQGYRQADGGSAGTLRMGVGASCLRKDGSEFPGDINLSPLQTNRGRLLMAVVRDVSERVRSEQALRESRQRLRDMAAQSEAVREYERKNIAREVHDELGQVLTALRMDLTFLDLRHGSQMPELQAKFRDMRGLVDRAILGVRNVAANLRPTVLDMGLIPAIDWLCSEFRRNTGLDCRFDGDASGIELAEDRAIGLFRIVQESLTNVTRYAQARQVQVRLQRAGDDLLLQVHDDGRGFDPVAAGRGRSFGLLGMQERAAALGGTLAIDSAPGQGTTIRVSVPLIHSNLWQELA